jgi:hypothetical protein
MFRVWAIAVLLVVLGAPYSFQTGLAQVLLEQLSVQLPHLFLHTEESLQPNPRFQVSSTLGFPDTRDCKFVSVLLHSFCSLENYKLEMWVR